MRKITEESRNKLESGTSSEDLQGKPAGQILTYTSHWPIVHQSETATQDQINQEYTSTQTLFTTFTQPRPMEVTSTSHPKMTQYCKEQAPPQWTSSRPMQLTWQVVTNRRDKTTPQTQAQTQSITEQQPDQPVTMDYKMTIHQTPQTPEMDQHASDAENKAT